MAKLSASRSRRADRRPSGSLPKGGVGRTKTIRRKAGLPLVGKARFEAVMQAARQSGLLSRKGGRIAGRVSTALVAQAKRQTGIAADSDLIAFALASVALEDNFAQAFRQSRGKVDPDLKLGF